MLGSDGFWKIQSRRAGHMGSAVIINNVGPQLERAGLGFLRDREQEAWPHLQESLCSGHGAKGKDAD